MKGGERTSSMMAHELNFILLENTFLQTESKEALPHALFYKLGKPTEGMSRAIL